MSLGTKASPLRLGASWGVLAWSVGLCAAGCAPVEAGPLQVDASVADASPDGDVDGAVADAASPDGGGDAGYAWDLPVGFPMPKVPEDNPMSEAKVELGRHLFYDTRLSENETQSCASCHQQDKAFTDGQAVGIGSTGEAHPRGSMSLANVAYTTTLTWANPALTELERQALVPLFGEHPVELGFVGQEDELLARLESDETYQTLFSEAFPDLNAPVRLDSVTKAIAAFERTLISGRSAYDRYVAGDTDAMGDSAVRGMELFFSERAECFHCHGGYLFADSETHEGKVFDEVAFHNNGLYNIAGTGDYPSPNEGLFNSTGMVRDMGRFKAPTLRNIAVTAPYMHDGTIATLEEVIAHYAAGGRLIEDGPYAGDGRRNPFKSEFVTGFLFDDQETADLLAFLEALTDEEFLADPRLSNPWPVD